MICTYTTGVSASNTKHYLLFTAEGEAAVEGIGKPRVGAGKFCSAEACFMLGVFSDFKLMPYFGVRKHPG